MNLISPAFAVAANGDSYNADDSVNAIDWNVRKANAAYADYYKGLIQIRQAFSPITDPDTEYAKTPLDGNTDSCIAISVENDTIGEWNRLVLILNNAGSTASVNLPAGSWSLMADGSHSGTTSLGTRSGSYTVPAYGSAILVQGSFSPVLQKVGSLIDLLHGISIHLLPF